MGNDGVEDQRRHTVPTSQSGLGGNMDTIMRDFWDSARWRRLLLRAAWLARRHS